jgi:hypothetical protein
LKELAGLKPEHLTPIESLELLAKLKARAEDLL